ncbi:Very-long-chain enoyl-CoA reductase [Diplonema papillatum]|nr:Very-long-chain enoyl-CoA reductase [Diplonema papillatum]
MPVSALAATGADLLWKESTGFQWGPIAAVTLWCCHFARRTGEALWVHQYSKPSVPLSDAIIEYVYYWICAWWIGRTLALSPPPVDCSSIVGCIVFLAAELCNARSHAMLRNLRSGKSTAVRIPRGFAFEYVSCPHYLFEILSWASFTLVAKSPAASTFAILGSVILVSWAADRHSNYKKTFNKRGPEMYPKNRKAIFPFVY